MIISHEQEVQAVKVTHPDALNAAMKTLMGARTRVGRPCYAYYRTRRKWLFA